ncbi:hypothetical protein DSO57_1009815 [Entomophthora muscae]|uniref:Uncharacterized protein n=1 Tax=Entomophthora muscae TaxID=34485 RepID=A0ACC2RXU8_9FUNG|nr:hypothetical protein DSO57_1009815 [Entomophthora muscae]
MGTQLCAPNLFATLDKLQEEQLAFDNPAISAEDPLYNVFLVETAPNTPPSSQNPSGPLLQEVEPQGSPQTSQCKPSQLNAADVAFFMHQPAHPLAPGIIIYPNNISMNNNDSPSDN